MARKITARLHISGTLEALTPLHVGGLGVDVDTDLPLARNGAGRYYVPGTSFAGALRAWCADVFDDNSGKGREEKVITRTEKVWGFQEGDEGIASWIFVEDAVLPETVESEVRDGVGIDRVWGCAAEHIKYDRAILPRGTELPLRMTVDVENEGDQTREMLAALLAALERGEVRFGAAQTRGLGRLKLKSAATVQEHAFKRDSPAKPGLLALLRGQLPSAKLPPVTASTASRPRLIVTITWQPVGPLMVKAGSDGIGVDLLPLMSGIDHKLAPVLPGSSIKGSLRSQAERIVRTLLGRNYYADRDLKLNPKERFLQHTQLPLIEELFGSPGMEKSKAKRKREHLGRGALGIDDCYAKCSVPPELWQAILQASPDAEKNQEKSALREKLDDARAGFLNWTAAFHVAVDRWTGGAAEGFLYSVLEPHGVEWEPLRLELDPKRLKGHKGAGLALLLFVLRDLSKGRLPLGFATNRGMGAIAVKEISFAAQSCGEPFNMLDSKILPHGQLSSLPPELLRELNSAWNKWMRTPEGDAS